MKVLNTACFLLFVITVDCRLKEQHRPCLFNPLCTCSNGGPDLGSVCCHNIPFMTVPSHINSYAIYIMSFKENSLRFLEDNSLNGTGLWKLQINNNLLTDLPSNALAGLEKTLSILDLSNNNLVRIPKEAIQKLEKLSNLNLAGNQITFLYNDDLRNIGRTLKLIDLSNNLLMHIQNDAFRNMLSLETLNLGYNSIVSIDDIVFQNGLNNLKQIILEANQLQQIPLNALANLKNIKIVNLNENFISRISEGREIRNRIYLDELHLENNLITELTAESFRLFNQINRIFLKGNPLTIINDTFIAINTTEIYVQHCLISVITKNAFFSIVNSLQVLDLSFNNLNEFSGFQLTRLIKLSLGGNNIVLEDIKSYERNLKYLDVTGMKISSMNQGNTKVFQNLEELEYSGEFTIITPETLQFAGPSLEKLYIRNNHLQAIENGAFHTLSGLKMLDLSNNRISKIGNSTFKDIGNCLEKLNLHKALKMTIFPYKTLNSLSKLEYIDISSNHFLLIPYESFSTFQNLKYLNLNHNDMKNLEINFISDLTNPQIEYLKIAFNKITMLKSYTFRNLQNLVYLQLNDNLIGHIKKSTFLDLKNIMSIQLEGNLIETIDNEAFHNLPNIQLINLAYNKLSSLNLEAFSQVGRLSSLKIKVDHNNIQNLTGNYTTHTSNNVKSINFSHNNITYIDENYFDPIRLSITALDLSYNKIFNFTHLAVANMQSLQKLIVSNNDIDVIDENEFKDLKELQILNLCKNYINNLPEKLFEAQNRLRIFSIAYNNLENLPTKIFSSTVLEQLDLSFNSFEEYPENALLYIQDTLQYLDLSGNEIKALKFSNFKNFQNLRALSLSQNKLHLTDSKDTFHLPKLISLDISHNSLGEIPVWITENLPSSLESINLANTSLKSFPTLNAYNVLKFNISSNLIKTIETTELEELKKIQSLDFSNNFLTDTYSNIFSNLQNLKTLYLQNNPIQKLTNKSFVDMEKLQELFIKNLNIQDIYNDAFLQLSGLKKLEIDTFKNVDLFDLLKNSQGIREIHLHVKESGLEGIFNNKLPKTLENITLEGEHLKHLDESLFSNIRSKMFTLDVRNSNLTKISQKVFQNMKGAKNISVSFFNNQLQSVGKLFSSTKQMPASYLKQLKIAESNLNCNCDFDWLWEWLEEYEYENPCEETYCDEPYLHDLRETKCTNMNNRSIINVFKTDLRCFSSNASPLTSKTYFYGLIGIVTLMYVKLNHI